MGEHVENGEVCRECPLVLISIIAKPCMKADCDLFVQYMQSWVSDENPCLICMCLDQQHINCTARPCNDIKGKHPFCYS